MIKETIKTMIEREALIEDMIWVVEQFAHEFVCEGYTEGVEACEELIHELQIAKHEEIVNESNERLVEAV